MACRCLSCTTRIECSFWLIFKASRKRNWYEAPNSILSVFLNELVTKSGHFLCHVMYSVSSLGHCQHKSCLVRFPSNASLTCLTTKLTLLDSLLQEVCISSGYDGLLLLSVCLSQLTISSGLKRALSNMSIQYLDLNHPTQSLLCNWENGMQMSLLYK